MRIEDVKVGDVVVPLPWSGEYDAVGEMGRRIRACHGLRKVTSVDRSDSTVELDCSVDGMGRVWWPVGCCDPTPHAVATPQTEAYAAVYKPDQSNATQLLVQLHDREVAALRQDIASAQRAVEAASRLVQNRDREEQVLRSQIAALEKQVADLKSERDRVGKTSQAGTRFAQLELD